MTTIKTTQLKDPNWYKSANEEEINSQLRQYLLDNKTDDFGALLDDVAAYCNELQQKQQEEDEKTDKLKDSQNESDNKTPEEKIRSLSLDKIINYCKSSRRKKDLIIPLINIAIEMTNIDVINTLIKKYNNIINLNINKEEIKQPIQLAISKHNHEIVKLLLENGVKPPNKFGNHSNDWILLAIKQHDVKICKLLMEPNLFKTYKYWRYDWVCMCVFVYLVNCCNYLQFAHREQKNVSKQRILYF